MVVVEVNGYTIEPGADLAGANLGRANLSGADLSGADLSGAILLDANLSEAKAGEETTWPPGFDPVAAGVIFD